MGGPLLLTVCRPTLNNELKNFRIRIFHSLHRALRNNLQDKLQETTAATTTATTMTSSTTENYRNFGAGFQWGHLRR